MFLLVFINVSLVRESEKKREKREQRGKRGNKEGTKREQRRNKYYLCKINAKRERGN